MPAVPVVAESPSRSERPLRRLSIEQHLALRKGVGYFYLPDSSLVEVRGPDTISYLQSQTTQDIAGLAPGCGAKAAILDRLARIEAHFSVFRLGASCWITAHGHSLAGLIRALERHHIAEDFKLVDHGSAFSLIGVEGPLAPGLLAAHADKALPEPQADRVFQCKIFGEDVAGFGESLTGERGCLLAVAKTRISAFVERLRAAGAALGLVEIDAQTLKNLRLEAGNLWWGHELDTELILPGSGLEEACVSISKGCFVGQEVVTRIRTQGRPPRRIMAARLDPGSREVGLQPGEVSVDGKSVGRVLASGVDSLAGCDMAILSLKRTEAVASLSLVLEQAGQSFHVQILELPLRHSRLRRQRAIDCYGQALRFFSGAEGDSAGDAQAIGPLEEAIAIDPGFGDAYEVLGVILGRLERYDEAIDVMQKLTLVDPNCVMAFSNLSIFHMKKGLITEAEHYRDRATALGFKTAARAAKGQTPPVEGENEARLQDVRRREKVFREVLRLDPGDIPALFGLGQCQIQLREFGAARQTFESLLKLDPQYSAAHLELGRCLLASGDRDAARSVFQNGVEVSKKRGDLMPMKQMATELAKLPQNT